jgi:predicted enzyme related to lactoylglutathione lyase
MSQSTSKLGTVQWVDLTVPDAPRVRDFYKAVVGWEPSGVDMGGYDDFNMMPPGSDKPACGVCNARGNNANLPAQWLIYVPVANLADSIAACERLGGKVVNRHSKTMCVIQDPAGAVMMIYEEKKSA